MLPGTLIDLPGVQGKLRVPGPGTIPTARGDPLRLRAGRPIHYTRCIGGSGNQSPMAFSNERRTSQRRSRTGAGSRAKFPRVWKSEVWTCEAIGATARRRSVYAPTPTTAACSWHWDPRDSARCPIQSLRSGSRRPPGSRRRSASPSTAASTWTPVAGAWRATPPATWKRQSESGAKQATPSAGLLERSREDWGSVRADLGLAADVGALDLWESIWLGLTKGWLRRTANDRADLVREVTLGALARLCDRPCPVPNGLQGPLRGFTDAKAIRYELSEVLLREEVSAALGGLEPLHGPLSGTQLRLQRDWRYRAAGQAG